MISVTEPARAKVNLTLRVVGRRADGYHDLESLVAFADCADRVDFTPGAALELVVQGPGAEACGALADNLVLRAAKRFADEIGALVTGRFTLDKRLPVAAGIGGGSADAAAALRCLARANAIALDDPRLRAVARAVGADVPVCLASSACVMSGVGENLVPLSLPRLPCVLVNPRIAVATPEVFAALGLKRAELLVGARDIVAGPAWPKPGADLARWLAVLGKYGNDLEAPALKIAPAVGRVLAALRATDGARLARMSGSGATCFALYDDDVSAATAAAALRRAEPRWWVHAGALS
jgi:4-diphosphocytidyl-2-C-methyl-D-erythritol kinase